MNWPGGARDGGIIFYGNCTFLPEIAKLRHMAITQVDIISGFLGAGKTTLIQYLFRYCYGGRKIAVIENDFGEVGIDGGLLESTGAKVTEIISGCICCTLVLDFQKAIETLAADPDIERIVIEPSGVAKLSDVLRACGNISAELIGLGKIITVVDALSYEKYAAGFGAFFLDQVRHADIVLISKVQDLPDLPGTELPNLPAAGASFASASGDRAALVAEQLRKENGTALINCMPWDSKAFSDFLSALYDGHAADDGTSIKTRMSAYSHHHKNEDTQFTSITLEPKELLTESDVRKKLRTLADRPSVWGDGKIARMKGILRTKNDGAVQADWVHGSFGLCTTDKQAEGKLVVIGTRIPEGYLRELFSAP
jgi:G3E family GTPase